MIPFHLVLVFLSRHTVRYVLKLGTKILSLEVTKKVQTNLLSLNSLSCLKWIMKNFGDADNFFNSNHMILIYKYIYTHICVYMCISGYMLGYLIYSNPNPNSNVIWNWLCSGILKDPKRKIDMNSIWASTKCFTFKPSYPIPRPNWLMPINNLIPYVT